jgi:hypothetical protein
MASVWIEQNIQMFFDPVTGLLLRARPSSLIGDQERLLRRPPQHLTSNTGISKAASSSCPTENTAFRSRPFAVRPSGMSVISSLSGYSAPIIVASIRPIRTR